MNVQKPLSSLWWLWIPVGVMALQISMEIFLPKDVMAGLHTENGPHELVEFFILLAAFVVALLTLRRLDRKAQPWLSLWVFIAACCCFYVGGEEVSWGQHIWDWSTPEYWGAVNDQNETNLHNTSSWLDQKPRLLLLAGIVCGGIVFPLLEKVRPGLLPAQFRIIYPPAQFSVIALLVIVPKLVEKTGQALDLIIFTRFSEVEELFMFYFVLLYLVVLKGRIPHTK